jgi:hypothetical protein
MAQELDDVIADLDAATAGLARSVKRCRNFLAERQAAPVAVEAAETCKSAFAWPGREES